MEMRSPVIARQHIRKCRDAGPHEVFSKPGTSVKGLESGKGLACHWTSPVCRAVDSVVMDHDEVVVMRQVHVEFQMVDSHLERQVKGRYSVLWGIGRRAPMCNDQEVLRGQM